MQKFFFKKKSIVQNIKKNIERNQSILCFILRSKKKEKSKKRTTIMTLNKAQPNPERNKIIILREALPKKIKKHVAIIFVSSVLMMIILMLFIGFWYL